MGRTHLYGQGTEVGMSKEEQIEAGAYTFGGGADDRGLSRNLCQRGRLEEARRQPKNLVCWTYGFVPLLDPRIAWGFRTGRISSARGRRRPIRPLGRLVYIWSGELGGKGNLSLFARPRTTSR